MMQNVLSPSVCKGEGTSSFVSNCTFMNYKACILRSGFAISLVNIRSKMQAC